MPIPPRAVLLAGLSALALLVPAASASAQVARDLPTRLPAGVLVDPAAPPLPGDITAATWTVADLDTGQVLAASDAHTQHAPASTLKVLTALALLPEVPKDAVVLPEQSDIDVDGSKVGLLHGVPYPAEELYEALLMASGNDTANVLGTAAGGHAAAAATMNRTARELGAVDTRAVNQHGLDADGQVSTAYDLAVIARAALAQPDIARWVLTRRATMAGRPGEPRFEIYNHNKLLGSYEGALGVKNGYTSRARASFIGAAERDGRRLVVTLMRAEPKVWTEAALLLDWGFEAASGAAVPVGALPAPPRAAEPEPESEQPAAVDAVPASSDLTPAAAPSDDPRLLPLRELAGVLLVAAALLAVRPGRRRPRLAAQRPQPISRA
jgi:serine-type D-Ala-D-Ala carboxypeptidase (penicillin-binding protein 5/6)